MHTRKLSIEPFVWVGFHTKYLLWNEPRYSRTLKHMENSIWKFQVLPYDCSPCGCYESHEYGLPSDTTGFLYRLADKGQQLANYTVKFECVLPPLTYHGQLPAMEWMRDVLGRTGKRTSKNSIINIMQDACINMRSQGVNHARKRTN